VRGACWAGQAGVVLRCEDAAGFDPGEAFFQGQQSRDFSPLTRVAEIGQIKPIIPGVLKPGKP
jgi:hypothetical protein